MSLLNHGIHKESLEFLKNSNIFIEFTQNLNYLKPFELPQFVTMKINKKIFNFFSNIEIIIFSFIITFQFSWKFIIHWTYTYLKILDINIIEESYWILRNIFIENFNKIKNKCFKRKIGVDLYYCWKALNENFYRGNFINF